MIRKLAQLWQEHRWWLLAFVAACGLTLFFGIRTVVFTLYWMDPAHQDQPIRAWMPPRYVALSYDLPPEVLGPVLGLSPDAAHGDWTMATLAARQGLTLAELQARIDAAVALHRAGLHD